MPTVVTAFYPLSKSKHGVAKYREWIQNFCKIPCQLVVFADSEYAEYIRGLRKGLPTHVIECGFDGWEMTTPAMMDMWRRHHAIDPEKSIHSPELYAVWAIKQEAVRRAISLNPFSSRWFIWCDIGIQRHSHLHLWYAKFASKTVCDAALVPGRMTFLEVHPIPDSYVKVWKSHTRMTAPVPDITLGGGCIAGDAEAWVDFGAAYVRALSEFDAVGKFAGKDQVVCFTMLMNRTVAKPYRLVKAKQFSGIGGIYWMSFPCMLGGSLPIEIDPRFE